MQHLAGASALRELNLAYSGVGDGALAQLGSLSRLRVLNLDSCHASDRYAATSSAWPNQMWFTCSPSQRPLDDSWELSSTQSPSTCPVSALGLAYLAAAHEVDSVA